MLDPASIAAGIAIGTSVGVIVGGLIAGAGTAEREAENAELRAENIALARKLTRILAPLERANHRRKLKAQIRRAEEIAIQAKRHEEMRETLEMVG